MKTQLVVSVGFLLVSAGLVSAQSTTQPSLKPDSRAVEADEDAHVGAISEAAPEEKPAAPTPPLKGNPDSAKPVVDLDSSDCCKHGPRFWASADYLLWWVKKAPVDAPLLTSNPSNGTAAALTDPGTVILFGPGGAGTGFGLFSGGRITAGGWLSSDQRLGFEMSGFLLERKSVGVNAASAGDTALGNPVNVVVPFGGNAPGEGALTNGNGAAIPEFANVETSTHLWGMEADAVFGLVDTERWHIQLLSGFRYLDLTEGLGVKELFPDATTGGVVGVSDGFGTRNQFYGGQIGARLGFTGGRFSAELTTLFAMGSDHEVLKINGSTLVTNGAFGFPTGTFPGGVYAEPSNIGTYRAGMFCVIPEERLQFGYNLTTHLRATVGYDFLYLSNVMRPGTEVDRNLNVNQNPIFNFSNGSTVVLNTPPNVPTALLNHSDFWAQGVTFGLEFRY